MTIRVLHKADEAIVGAFLAVRLESSIFLQANLLQSGFTDKEAPYHGTYVGAFEEGRLIGVAAHYWNGMVILQAPGCAGPLARAAVDASPRALKGIIGPLSQSLDALKALGISRDSLATDSPEILYHLRLDDLVVPPERPGQRLAGRVPKAEELPQLIEWTLDYDQEAMGIKPTPARRELVTANSIRAMETGTRYVLTDKDALVAKTGFNAEVPGMVQIGGVWTPPALRGRGYARAAVARHLVTARARGVGRAILFTGEDNVPAQRAYEAIGFERIGDYAIMFVGD